MTTGTVSHDLRSTFQVSEEFFPVSGDPFTTVYSPSLVGYISYKTWNGGDDPVRRPYSIATLTYPRWFKPRYSRAGVRLPLTTAQRANSVITVKRRVYPPDLPRVRPPHPYVMTSTGYRYTPTVLTKRRADGSVSSVLTTSTYGLRSPIGVAQNYVDSGDQLALLGRLRTKLAGSDFDCGVFLGEGHQALRLIGDAAIRIATSLTRLRSGDLHGATAVLLKGAGHSVFRVPSKHKSLADRWLELQYGWRPLVDDIYNGATFVARFTDVPFVGTYKVRLQKSLVYSPNSQWVDQRGGSVDKLQLVAYIKEVDVARLIGLTDPATVAFNLAPWSFLADWVIPIGSWLQSRGLASALEGTFVTTLTRMEKNTYSGFQPGSSDSYVMPDGPSTARYTYVNRTVSSSLDVPFPNVKPLGKIVTWSHAANGIALLTQAFRK